MGKLDDPFRPLAIETTLADDFAALQERDILGDVAAPSSNGATIGRMVGFDLLDQPLVGDLPQCPGLVVVARSTIALRRSMAGAGVVVLFDGGDVQRPIIVGAIRQRPVEDDKPAPLANVVAVEVDSDRRVLTAEREIVLRCGDASITLTRAGKVVIQGTYILSRSTGYNKIKGAAIDIN
jgi:hypothetical protein